MPEYKTSTFALIATAFITGIIAISCLITTINESMQKTAIVNKASVSQKSLRDKELDMVKDHIRGILKNCQGIKDDQDITISIRESSLKQYETGNHLHSEFIADVDQAKVSYLVSTTRDPENNFSIQISCTGPKESKYPNVFCISDNGYNTIDAALGDELPYSKTKDDGRLYYKLKHINNDKKLIADAIIPCGDQEAQQDVLNSAKDWVASHGVDRNLIPIEINPNSCYAAHELHR